MIFEEIFNGLPANSENIHQLIARQDQILLLNIEGKGSGQIRSILRRLLKSLGIKRSDNFNLFMTKQRDEFEILLSNTENIVYSAKDDYGLQDTHLLNEVITLDYMPPKFMRRMRDDYVFMQHENVMIFRDYTYMFFVLKTAELKNFVREEAGKLGYLYQSQNSFGMDCLRDTKVNHNVSSFDLPPAETIKSIELPGVLQDAMLQRFSYNDSVAPMQRQYLRYLDFGYFVRVELDYKKAKKDLNKLLAFLGEIPSTGIVYHGFIAEKEPLNQIINTVILSDYGLPYRLPSFWKDLPDISDYISKEYEKVIYDEAIFINSEMTFSFYDMGFDINFVNLEDRELFIKVLISDGYRIAHYPGSEREHYDMYTQKTTYWEL